MASDVRGVPLAAHLTDKWFVVKVQTCERNLSGNISLPCESVPSGIFSLLCANPVCKSQPIDAVVELGWD